MLFDVICARGLEGVVGKRLRDPYRSGERLWVKTKNRATARFQEELHGARRRLDFAGRFDGSSKGHSYV